MFTESKQEQPPYLCTARKISLYFKLQETSVIDQFFRHSLDKKPKPVTMGNEKKRRERISSSIHTLADMLPEAMRDPKHKEVL